MDLSDPVQFLARDNLALKRAGAKLAAAAQLVATEYDGIHRLHLALVEWNQTVADEGGRAERYGKPEPG